MLPLPALFLFDQLRSHLYEPEDCDRSDTADEVPNGGGNRHRNGRRNDSRTVGG
jgi:hypothetical protein